MALIPIHTRRPAPPDLQALLDVLPESWVDDGLTNFPDSVFGWDISQAGTGHDAFYCTRMWPAGTMDRAHRELGDRKIGEWIHALLPWGLRQTGLAVSWTVYQVGGMKAFDSCGLDPYGATEYQRHMKLCRHGVMMPPWLSAAAALARG